MNKAKPLSKVIPKSKTTQRYDQSYLTLLKETLADEISLDHGGDRLLNDSTRAFLNSTWYKNPEKNIGAKRNVLSLPAVSSYLEVLQRQGDFKQAFQMLNVIKHNQIEWVKPSENKLYTDDKGIPEEIYFSLNKLMSAYTKNVLSRFELRVLEKHSYYLLEKYCTKINNEQPSISFLIRSLRLINKSRSIFRLEGALDIIFKNCKDLPEIGKKTIKDIAMLNFYQETDQRAHLVAYFKNNILGQELMSLFAVQFEIERFIDRFVILGDEDVASMGIETYSKMGFGFRKEQLIVYSSFVERLSLKKINKLLLELYPDTYAPICNTLCLNDIEDSDMDLVLRILHGSNIDIKQFEENLDFLTTKVPIFTEGTEYYAFLRSLVKPEYNLNLKAKLFEVILKAVSSRNHDNTIIFLEHVLNDPDYAVLFEGNGEYSVDYSLIFGSLFAALSHSTDPVKKTASDLFRVCTKLPEIQLTPFHYSILFKSSLQGNTYGGFYPYYSDFLKKFSKRFLAFNGNNYYFSFPTSINNALSEASDALGYGVKKIEHAILEHYKIHGIEAEISDAFLENIIKTHPLISYKPPSMEIDNGYMVQDDIKNAKKVNGILKRIRGFVNHARRNLEKEQSVV